MLPVTEIRCWFKHAPHSHKALQVHNIDPQASYNLPSPCWQQKKCAIFTLEIVIRDSSTSNKTRIRTDYETSYATEDKETNTAAGGHVHVRRSATNQAFIYKIGEILTGEIHPVQWHSWHARTLRSSVIAFPTDWLSTQTAADVYGMVWFNLHVRLPHSISAAGRNFGHENTGKFLGITLA